MKLPGYLVGFCLANLAVLVSIQFVARMLSVELQFRHQFCDFFYVFGALVGVLTVSQFSPLFSIRTAIIVGWGMVVAVLSSSTYELEVVHWPDSQVLYQAVSKIPLVAFFSSFVFCRFAELFKIQLTKDDGNAIANRLTIAKLLVTTLAVGLFFSMTLKNEKVYDIDEYCLLLLGPLIASVAFAGFLVVAWDCGRAILSFILISIFAATGIAIHLFLPGRISYLCFMITSLTFYLTLNQLAFCRLIQPLLPCGTRSDSRVNRPVVDESRS